MGEDWPTWSQDAGEVAAARVLASLLMGLRHDGATEASTGQLVDELGLIDVDPDHLAAHFVELGYFRKDSVGFEPGSDTLLITPEGRAVAGRFKAARQKFAVARAARSALLRWLYETEGSGGDRRSIPDAFLSEPFSWFYGNQFTAQQVIAAARNLRERGYIDAEIIGDSNIFGVHLTARGEDCVERYDANPDAPSDNPNDFEQAHRIGLTLPVTLTEPGSAPTGEGPLTVFLVHGHDNGLKNEIARFIEQTLEPRVTVVILHEKPNAGRTLIEKFEEHARTASYAVVLLTPDDRGGPATGDLKDRARQNVVFELGFFYGSLGRNHVAAINKGVENPSDIDGVAYISYSGQWKDELRREFSETGLPLRT